MIVGGHELLPSRVDEPNRANAVKRKHVGGIIGAKV